MLSGWALLWYVFVLIKRRNLDPVTDMHTEGTQREHKSRDWGIHKPRNTKEPQQASRSQERGLDQILLHRSQKEPALMTPSSQTSRLQNHEMIQFYLHHHPRLSLIRQPRIFTQPLLVDASGRLKVGSASMERDPRDQCRNTSKGCTARKVGRNRVNHHRQRSVSYDLKFDLASWKMDKIKVSGEEKILGRGPSTSKETEGKCAWVLENCGQCMT